MIVREIAFRSPLDAFAPLAEEPYACLLHAGSEASAPGWSIVAAFPSMRLECRRGLAILDGRKSERPPFDVLGALHQMRRCAGPNECRSPFLTGLIGFAGYELGALVEPTAEGPPSPFLFPDCAFGAYDASVLFNHAANRAFVVGRAERDVRRLEDALGGEGARQDGAFMFEPPRSNFTPQTYARAVADAIELIRGGAFFQVNLSQQIVAECVETVAPYQIFIRLAQRARFGAYLCYRQGAILSASPERFFSVAADGDGWRVTAEPIKGTRPRSADAYEDERLAQELQRSAKDRAENVMIADLLRNDLSTVCADGSIREDAICALVSTPGIHHLASKISGRLRNGMTAADVLKALFPCGSVTGAPKVEAMRTIAAIEGRGRGPYCGAIGYIDDRGGADFAVAIRLLIAERRDGATKITVPVGGGVTLRSDPEAEYRETLLKARDALAAMGLDQL
ncbi:MAG: anthranilate synthase component I family protein [Parvularculaceae bacterium]|nr:anthranilate synthase component I family protein [Parvularculaceae bacterium]